MSAVRDGERNEADERDWTRVASASELVGDGPHAASARGVDVVVVRTKRGLKAFEGLCPHQGALLGEGELDEGTLVCRNHRWRFSVETGRRDGGPQCLRACPVREAGGEIQVDVSALRPSKARATQAARRPEDLPGPRGVPILGNALTVRPNELHLQLEAWAREFGTPFCVRLGTRKIVTFSEMDDILPVLKSRPDVFRRTSNIEMVLEELGVAGVFSAEGAAWRPQRRLAMEALSHRHLRTFYPTLAAVAERLRGRWSRLASRGDALDVCDELKRFTVDVTTALAFGLHLDTINQEEDVIQRKLELLFPMFHRRIFALFPWWHIVRTPSDRRADRAVAELYEWFEQLIAQTRARLDADPARAARPANFFEAMVLARDDDGEPFSNKTIIGNAFTMLLAGEDTTAYTLAWAVHHLADAPHDVAALRREADAALGDAAVPPTIEVANRLEYAGAVAQESMRLRPVAPMLLLQPNVATEVADVAVDPSTVVNVLLRPSAVDPAHFGDPLAFRPARWVDEKATGGQHEPGAMQPFGSGPRICPGRSLALLEMKVALATLYRHFEVERVGEADAVREHFAFTMAPVGLRARLRPRARSR